MANVMNDGATVRKYRESLRDCLPHMKPMVAPFVIGDIEPYQSPIDSRVIHSRKDHKDDLLRNGCRVYEGRQQEQQAVDQHKAEEDVKFEQTVGETLAQTAAEIKDGRTAIDKSGKIPFTFGME